jgi:hypothetical protein
MQKRTKRMGQRRILLALLVLSARTIFTSTFTLGAIETKQRCTTSSTAIYATSRKEFLSQFVVAGSLLIPTAASADITNKVASSAALRKVKICQKKLVAMEDYVLLSDYAAIKDSLRAAPFSDVRKAASTLVRGGEDGPDAEGLQTKYKAFITSIEKMDGTASVALRGRKLSDGEFLAAYSAAVVALADFVALAEEAIKVPLREEPV